MTILVYMKYVEREEVVIYFIWVSDLRFCATMIKIKITPTPLIKEALVLFYALTILIVFTRAFNSCDRYECVSKLNQNTWKQRDLVGCQFAGDGVRECRYCACQFKRSHKNSVTFVLCILFGFMNRACGMLRRCVKGVHLQRSVSDIDHVVPRSCGNDDGVVFVDVSNLS